MGPLHILADPGATRFLIRNEEVSGSIPLSSTTAVSMG